jgi:hypothetical protein
MSLSTFAIVIFVSLTISNLSNGQSAKGNGILTFYDVSGRPMFCGGRVSDASKENLAAVSAKVWNDQTCRKCVRVSVNGKTINVPIKDKCVDCEPNRINLSRSAFAQLANPNQGTQYAMLIGKSLDVERETK